MRTKLVLPILGLAAIALATIPAPARAQPSAPPTLAILPIKLLDTSAEPIDQSLDHARRLKALTEALTGDLSASGLYRTILVSREQVLARCPDERPACLLDAAREAGGDLVFVGVVHKSSTLIMQLWARLVDTASGKEVFVRDLNFRGDTDEAWQRAARFLSGQVKEGRAQP